MTAGVRKIGTYAALLAAVALFVASLGIAAARLLRIEQDVARDFGENLTWAVSQSELELMRFLSALDRAKAGATEAGDGAVARRFDLLWSRVALLREGEMGARLATIDGVRRTVDDAAAVLADLDPLLARLGPTDAAEVERRLMPLLPRLHEAAVWTMQAELDRLVSRGEERRSAMLGVFAHLAALVVSGGILTLLLIREIRSTQRLTTTARFAEMEARTNEQRFRDIVDAASDWVWETGPDHRLTYVSEQILELSGEEPRDVLGKTRSDMRLPDDLDDANWAEHQATLDARRPFRDFVFPYHDREGRRHFCRIHGKPVFGADGTFHGYRGTGSDITERVLAEQTLKESEDRFRTIAEGVPLPVIIARMDKPLILFVNARATETFALQVGSGGEAIQACYVRPDDRKRLLSIVDRDGRIDAFEVEFRRADGQAFWALVSARTLTYKGEAAIMTAVTDIADRRRMEEALRESEARLAAFLQHAPVNMFLKDTAGRYLMANPELTKIFRRPVSDLLGRTAADFLDPETAAQVAKRDRTVLTTGTATVQEMHLPGLQDYSWSLIIRFPIRDAAGRITHIGGFDVDITWIKEAERRLRDSEQRFRRLAEAHPVPVVVIALDEGACIFASPPLAELLTVPLDELLGRPLHGFFADSSCADRILDSIRNEHSLNGIEVLLRAADGREFWAALDARLIDLDGRPAAVVGMTDLTERKRAEAEIERQRETLHQSEKLAALGSLLAGVAHELNNPLSVVVGHATMLQELAPDAPSRDRAAKIKAAAERCARIVRTFLAMARKKPQERGPVRLDTVIEGVLEILAYGLRTSGIEVERALDPTLPPVFGDGDQLHQVIMNLIVNAQQALQGHPPPRRLRVAARALGGEICVEVADNGPGIEPDILKRIFDPFFTTKPMGLGTGIGLSVCHSIVQAHGGRIEVDSRPGAGTTFTVRLPVSDAPDQPAATEMRAASAGRAARILVVDDEPEIGELLAEMLAHEGHEATVVSNGRAALEWLASQSTDLIISDLRMPEMDGATLYRELAARRPELLHRILFITGDSLSPDLTQFLAETGVPVIEKPYDLRDVARQVEAKLELKQLNQ
ncbi:MAG TPA: PAS domain S-box protein [Azospirillum sp.]|nr:PAS domain S-box protein [Azospirillum sp.]